MSWKFAGILFEKDYEDSYGDLLAHLNVEFSRQTGSSTFLDTINRRDEVTMLGMVNDRTMLLNPFLPYDCSYVPDQVSPLDKKLASLSLEGDILSYIVDGASEAYGFSWFSQQKRIRRWACLSGKVLCDDGQALDLETSMAHNSPAGIDDLPDFFALSEDQAHLMAVWEAFLGIPFQELVQDTRPLFQIFE